MTRQQALLALHAAGLVARLDGTPLDLAREASGDPYLVANGSPSGWSCWPAGLAWVPDCETEDEAIGAALIALAEAL